MRESFKFTTLKRRMLHDTIMMSSMFIHSCAYALLLLGILAPTSPLLTAYPDSRDSPSALFSDRGSEQTVLGIQLLHYCVGGTVIWALAGNLLTINRKKNHFDSISLDSFSPVPLPTGTMKRLEAAMNSMARTEEDSQLIREIALVNGTSPGNAETRGAPASQKIDARSIDSLIDGACLLLAGERPVKVKSQASGSSVRNLVTACKRAHERIEGLINAFLNRKP